MKSDRITRFTPALLCSDKVDPPWLSMATHLGGGSYWIAAAVKRISLQFFRNPHVAWTSELRGSPLGVSIVKRVPAMMRNCRKSLIQLVSK